MTAHLLALSIGPVQEFIAAARRTRDLWFGSNLLSEISKATAKTVCDQGGSLIFPAPSSALDLAPDSELNVANIILAELHGPDPKTVAQSAKAAAQARWRQYADRVFNEYQPLICPDLWDDQVGDVIEFYAAWVLYAPETYKGDRARLMRLLAGRKNCRDFSPAKGREGRAGKPKSSLDGLRESVLEDPRVKPWPERSRRRLRLREGEQLDVVGLVKRTGAGHRPYPSVARVAADPWIRRVGDANLASLRDICERLGKEVIHPLDTSAERGHPHYAAFPFEGTAVFRSRYNELKKETELSDDGLQLLSNGLQPLTKQHGDPSPYLAVLVADGDQMGNELSKLESADDHRNFSQQLSRFAGKARQVIHEHHGLLVYSGGDDVLAFVPVDQCLECARALHTTFNDLLQEWSEKSGMKLTLSVGVAIAHFMENLEDLLDYGRFAEKHAKNPRSEDGGQNARDGLAVHLHKRGGGPIAVRANWTDDLDRRLVELANHLNSGAVPGRVAVDLHQIAQAYDGWPDESVAQAIQRDTLRVIAGKQPREAGAIERIRELVRARVTDAASLRRLGDELLVARQIADATRQANGQSAVKEVSL